MNKYFKWLIWPVAIVPAIYLATAWKSLPEEVAMHFDLHGEPDRYGDKTELLLVVALLCLVSVGAYFLLSNIYKVDPKRYAAENKDRLQRMGFAMGIFISAICCVVIYSTIKGSVEFGMRYIFAGVGLLFCLMGNYMHNIKPNYFAGFRLPWTLNDEENWRKTHLLGGKLWFGGGLVIAILCPFLPETVSLVFFFIVMMILVFIPIVYSYRLYKKNNQAGNKTTA
ncbi:MAG: SdpI family protein [Chitinophagaceae bacterium]